MTERAYADVVGNFNRGRAGAYARNGNYEGASRALAVDDPAASEAYRARGREEDETAYRRDYAGQIATGNYSGAAERAGKFGDVAGVTGARAAEVQISEQQRTELWRGANQSLAELEAIDQQQGQGYDDYVRRAREALQQHPDMDPGLRRLAESLPDVWNPNVTGAVRSYVTRIRDGALTPQQASAIERENSRAERGRRRPATPQEVAAAGLRPGTAAQIDGDGQVYVLQSPPTADQGGAPPSGYRWTEDGNLQAIPGGPGGRAAALSDGQRVASASALRMNEAETRLQQFEGSTPSQWANALEVLPVFGEGASAGARTPEQRALDQASNQWAEAFLRATSGAAVTADEIRRVERIFMPRPGDGAPELARKREARRVAQEAIEMGLPDQAIAAANGGAGGAPAAPAGAPSGALPPVNQRVIGEIYDMAPGGPVRRGRWNGRTFDPVED